jgi:mannosyltransferase OCH1-like enzyme
MQNTVNYIAPIMIIPKIIHQIWSGIDETLPEQYKIWNETWKRDYPDWEYMLWDNEQMETFVKSNYPQYWNIYRRFPYHIQRWDAVRYLILDKIGGMYVDCDYESIKPMHSLLAGKSCGFALEPDYTYRFFNKRLMFNNALMFSAPGHFFMQKVIQTVFSERSLHYSTENKNECVMNTTGPWALIELYEQLPDSEKSEIFLIPARMVTPLDGAQAKMALSGIAISLLQQAKQSAYAIHYFHSSWRKEEKPVNRLTKKRETKTIPRIIHQVWSGKYGLLPSQFAIWGETWKKHHPDHEYKLWDEQAMLDFVGLYYPQYMKHFLDFPYDIQRWDTIRYLILHELGGVYADFDYESLKPVDSLISGKTCCFSSEYSSTVNPIFNNAFMACVPGHFFMKKIIEYVFSNSCLSFPKSPKGDCVMSTTGPWMLMKLYNQLTQEEKQNIWLAPARYVTPLNWKQAQIAQNNHPVEYQSLMKEAYAVHYFCSTWWDKKEE